MSKINASQVIVNFEGQALKNADKDLTIGQALANILLSYTKGEKMRNFLLAKDFYKGGDIELNTADISLLKTACEACEIYNNLVLGQILEIIESLKNEK